MRANFLRFVGHDIDEFSRHLCRLDARQPNAKVAWQRRDRADQVRQPRPFFLRLASIPLDAVMSKMNASQHDLAIAAIDEPTNFVQDVLHGPTGEGWPH